MFYNRDPFTVLKPLIYNVFPHVITMISDLILHSHLFGNTAYIQSYWFLCTNCVDHRSKQRLLFVDMFKVEIIIEFLFN